MLGTSVTPTIISLGETNKEDQGIIVENGESATNYIAMLLDSFAVDLVIIAPACKAYAPIELPPAWTKTREDLSLSVADVVIVSKPVGSLAALKSSWLSRSGWQLDSGSL